MSNHTASKSDSLPDVAELLNLVQDYGKEIVKLNDELETIKKTKDNPITNSVNDELRKQAKSDATLIRSLEDNILTMDEETKVLKAENERLVIESTSSTTSDNNNNNEAEIDVIDSKKLLEDFQLLRSEVCLFLYCILYI